MTGRWAVLARWDMSSGWHVFLFGSECEARDEATRAFEVLGYMEVYTAMVADGQDHGPAWRQAQPGPWEQKRRLAPEHGGEKWLGEACAQ